MIRLIGVCAVIAGSYIAGALGASFYKKQLLQTEGLYRLVCKIKADIEGLNLPLSDIYASFSDRALDECGFTEILRSSGLTQASFCVDLCVSSEVSSIIDELSARLGNGSREEQVLLCQHYGGRLSELCSLLSAEQRQKSKLVRTVCAAAGAMIAIMLI